VTRGKEAWQGTPRRLCVLALQLGCSKLASRILGRRSIMLLSVLAVQMQQHPLQAY
jgi:hypothetical protein